MKKTIWITGASSGIGEALALAYNAAGAKIILSSRNQTALQLVKSKCVFSENVRIQSLDLLDAESLPADAEAAWKLFGSIDIVIHSGGISQRGLAMETAHDTESRIMQINFWGTVIISKALIPHMIAAGGGQIVCISSLVGKFGTRFRSAYAASKHALHGYFDSLRIELSEKNIDISIICPGFIKTNVSINALNASGTAQGTMDDAQNNGMSASDFAVKAMKAIENRREEVYIGGKEIYGIWIRRLAPALFSKIMRKAKVV